MPNHDEYITAPVRIIDGIARPVRVECIVVANVDGPTLWDCPCDECRGLRRHAAWMDAD